MKRAGIYIHIPFCRSRCSYCDFATGAYEGQLAERYVSALTTEISTFKLTPADALETTIGGGKIDDPRVDDEAARDVDTIYFGGGTPSLLTPAQVGRILRAVRERFCVAPEAEVTLEMNPGTVSVEIVERFRACGVNRASFGLQTFDDEQLRRLGRTHTADDARRTPFVRTWRVRARVTGG